MGSPRLQLCLQQAHFRPAGEQSKDGMRGLALRVDRNPALATFGKVFVQGKFYMLGIVHPAPLDQYEIALVGTRPMLPDHVVQRRQRQTLFADQQDARRLAVKPVSQFQELGQRTLTSQRLDDAEADPATAMYCNTFRLVDDQQRIILEEDRQIDTLLGDLVDFILRLHRNPDRRNAQGVANAYAIGCINPPAIYPHLATAQDAINMALGNPLATPDEEVIKALALLFIADHDICD